LAHTYFSGLDALFKASEPTLRGVARVNLEWMTLATRRAQAWLDFPAVLGACRTPYEVLNQEVKFCQVAAEQYTVGSQRLFAALSACAVLPGMFRIPTGGVIAAPARDYLSLTEPDKARQGEEAASVERRAA
jgi:hypothetical protein